MSKCLVISVGVSLPPVIESISRNNPEYILFIASKDTKNDVSSIFNEIKIHPQTFTIILNDFQDLNSCVQQLYREIPDYIQKFNVSYDQCIADFTGGTKVMSSALVLVSMELGFSFSYVGGDKRDNSGKGIVESGSEKLFKSSNIWDIAYIPNRKKVDHLIEAGDYDAAYKIVKEIWSKNPSDPLFSNSKLLLEGYIAWERFNHKEAKNKLSNLKKNLEIWNLKSDGDFSDFFSTLSHNISFLNVICNKNDPNHRTNIIIDLFENATRRGKEGKYDDAVARLYRLTEMIAQN